MVDARWSKHLLDAQSLFVRVDEITRLHLRHFPGKGMPVFLVHGAIENGRIFYSHNGKGLAPYLQQLGYDVYVLDLRGRGLSEPKPTVCARHGQLESICIDLPAASNFIESRRPGIPQIWMSHSWGGVLQMSCLARFSELRRRTCALVHFAVKRSITVWSWQRLLRVEFGWKRLLPLVSRWLGYVPAARIGLGSDIETHQSLVASIRWVAQGPWVDPDDGFDYADAADEFEYPPSLWLTGVDDRLLGAPRDVLKFMDECGVNESSFILLDKDTGALDNYDHISIMTHPKAPKDHFVRVSDWLNGVIKGNLSESSFSLSEDNP